MIEDKIEKMSTIDDVHHRRKMLFSKRVSVVARFKQLVIKIQLSKVYSFKHASLLAIYVFAIYLPKVTYHRKPSFCYYDKDKKLKIHTESELLFSGVEPRISATF